MVKVFTHISRYTFLSHGWVVNVSCDHCLAATVRSIFLLRTLRRIKQTSPTPSEVPPIPLAWFAGSLIRKLQSLIATGTSARAVALLQRNLRKRKWEQEAPAMVLWEGSPVMPVQPSPVVFKFLLELVTDMAALGRTDVWTPGTVEFLVGMVRGVVVGMVEGEVEGRVVGGEGEADTGGNGKGVGEDNTLATKPIELVPAEKARIINPSWVTQLIFDMAYLHNALARPQGAALELPECLNVCSITTALSLLYSILTYSQSLKHSVNYEELDRRAKDYWKRTALLYSLLAV